MLWNSSQKIITTPPPRDIGAAWQPGGRAPRIPYFEYVLTVDCGVSRRSFHLCYYQLFNAPAGQLKIPHFLTPYIRLPCLDVCRRVQTLWYGTPPVVECRYTKSRRLNAKSPRQQVKSYALCGMAQIDSSIFRSLLRSWCSSVPGRCLIQCIDFASL